MNDAEELNRLMVKWDTTLLEEEQKITDPDAPPVMTDKLKSLVKYLMP